MISVASVVKKSQEPMKAILIFTVVASMIATLAFADELPQTRRLEWEEADLSTRLMDGAHRFVERKIAESVAKRSAFWKRDFSSTEAYAKSIDSNREHFKTIIGVVDGRLPPAMERYGDDSGGPVVAQTAKYRVIQVRWPVLEGFWGCGLLVQQFVPLEHEIRTGVLSTIEARMPAPVAHVVLIPDAGQTPEQLLGLAPGIPAGGQIARRLAENGFELILPQTISREKLVTTDERTQASDQTHREWIYRQAFHMGRHVIGYEVQTVLGAVDWFKAQHGQKAKIGVCGYAEGGLTALYAAAADPRIDAALVSGYFDSRQKVWSEPIYRNVWSLLREFGDAELAGLILPRDLVIEHSPVPDVVGHKGEWHTPTLESVTAEVNRIEIGSLFQRPRLRTSDAWPYSDGALTSFAGLLGAKRLSPWTHDIPEDKRKKFDAGTRHARFFQEMEGHVQRLIQKSEHVRDDAFLYQVMPEFTQYKWSTEPQHPTHSPQKFIEGSKRFREQFLEEGMGRFDEPLLPFNARTRLVAESEKWKAYDVVLDVYPELFAWGLLVLPKDLKPGERRPVVVCQHGRNGIPRNLLDGNTTGYRNIAATLAERGFITFAPHNLYRGEDRYRWLNRKANNVKATLFSFMIPSHDQILRWLESQPFVDGKRIAFYGLSYGGETAVRVPPLLDKYCLSICSGDFNQWTRKVASTDQPFSFMRTIEWEMPYWNLGHTFDYAEMSYLMVPRPFMVERGHNDLVGKDQWVAHEYAKVRWLYAQLGLADRTEITFFQGGHSMQAEGTVDFLHRHLNWPPQAQADKKK
ncbi:MAG: putative dienelactone hydrolase [Planctomycetaceae bacterium]|nr:putative dienelactone hydrolase [Planctomycetaceae bacterium]